MPRRFFSARRRLLRQGWTQITSKGGSAEGGRRLLRTPAGPPSNASGIAPDKRPRYVPGDHFIVCQAKLPYISRHNALPSEGESGQRQGVKARMREGAGEKSARATSAAARSDATGPVSRLSARCLLGYDRCRSSPDSENVAITAGAISTKNAADFAVGCHDSRG